MRSDPDTQTASARPVSGRRRRRLGRGLLAAASLMVALSSFAGADDSVQPPSELKKLSLDELFDLEVTSVSQKAEPLSKTAAAVHVVTAEDLRRSGALSIPEALRNIRGVEVARVDSRQYAITARGFNGTVANKLLVLIDGRSVYTPLFSGVFWDAQDAFLEDIERIEVIRGPGATTWGANAVNGVINIMSAHAAETQGLLVTGGGGNAERGFGGARFGGSLGSRAFFRLYAKGFDREASRRPNGQDAGDDFRRYQGGLRVDWTPAAIDAITLQGDLYDGEVLQPSAPSTDLSGGSVTGRWTRRFSDRSELEAQAYWDRTERDIPLVFGETLDTWDATLRHRFSPAARHDLVWGAGVRLTDDEVRNSPGLAFLPERLTQRLYNFFIQDELSLLEDRVRLSVGSKFEHNDYTGFEYQPGARLVWTPAPTQTFWSAVSRAVRMPSRVDRDLFSPATPPFVFAGGPDFESEVLRAFEVGYRAQPDSALSLSIATYYNLYDKLRSLETGTPIVLANGVEGSAYGVEVGASYLLSAGWRLQAGYTFARLELDATPSSTDTSQVKQAGDSPRHQAYVRSSVDLPRGVEVDVTVRHVDELPNQRVPAYTTCDSRLGWHPMRELEIALVGRNLFDPRHAEFGQPATRREIQRSVYAKGTWRF